MYEEAILHDELCATFVLSARLFFLFFLLEECLEYGLVVPFPAYGFAALVSHNESHSLNSLGCRGEDGGARRFGGGRPTSGALDGRRGA